LYDIACEVEQAGNIYADLIGYLHESPCADLDETIAALGCSKRTLQRLVNAKGGGLTFMEIRQAVRICLSKELVRGTLQSFTEIAVNTGFYDAAHFCRAFYKSCGLSPSEYRRLARHSINGRWQAERAARQAA
jgi:AraC-like DNA-binding protein